MSVRNAEIAIIFEEIADLLELQQANPFQVRAYRQAASTLTAWPEQMGDMAARGKQFDELPHIGKDLAGKIAEILARGSCDQLERLSASFPRGIAELLNVPGLGPRRVHTLYHELGISSPAQLLCAARDGRIRSVPGFGAASEQRIAEATAGYMERARRWPPARVTPHVDALLAYLRAAPGVTDAMVVGSCRRRRDTVGDLDILIVATPTRRLSQYLTRFDEVDHLLSQGTTRASVVLKDGLQVDFRVISHHQPRRRDDLFHRLQGAQPRTAPDCPEPQAEDQRVRCVSRWQPHSRRHRSIGLQHNRSAMDCT
jgi:DNA polymerase (family 10)